MREVNQSNRHRKLGQGRKVTTLSPPFVEVHVNLIDVSGVLDLYSQALGNIA